MSKTIVSQHLPTTTFAIPVLPQVQKLGLRVNEDTSQRRVKVYDLVPEIGIMRGFGANIQDRDALIQVLHFRDLLRSDGIYLLFRQMSVTYVGISQKIKSRLTSHRYFRDWDRVIAFYSVREALNPNIAGFVERKLFDILSQRGFTLEQKPPEERFLSQQDEIIMRQVIQEIDRVLQLLDMASPSQSERSTSDTSKLTSQMENGMSVTQAMWTGSREGIEVALNTRKVRAIGVFSQYGLEVVAGSEGTAETSPHMKENIIHQTTIEKLQHEGIVEIGRGKLRFLQSYMFSSPSAAARILTGSNRPGPLVWKRVSDGKSLKELEDQIAFS